MADEHRLHAEVLTPEGPVFEGEVHQLSTRTVVGEIGVLANHVPLVARLVPAELRLHLSEGDADTRRWAQAEGWLEVFANRALVLIGEAIPPDQLDAPELEQRLADAEQRLADAEQGSATYEQAERDKARAEAFLGVAQKK
ncbi:MAG TPA: ATP synthase F1 subunit epsilon [Solirubrobacterales bacterium]|nr:ATP synthase F1 subunit epsilon [Solirubrobacterales bacterium]